MRISVITPWKNGMHLLEGYAAAVNYDCEVITVDNGSDPQTAAALAGAGGIYIRNDANLGFAAANNQGYAKATGDIIVFLNSDVAPAGPWLDMVAQDVKEGALYGPSLQYQLVAGHHLPYLEGWCVAGTRATWERLRERVITTDFTPDIESFIGHELGPWNALSYPGPYWEDNELCFRALQAGFSLIQTAWPIQHKGGQTAGSVARHAQSFAANERTFTERVLAALPEAQAVSEMHQRYQAHCVTPSDIQHHLPLLFSLARGNVLELGTRSGVSTAALLAGVEAHGGHVTSVDLDGRSAEVAKGHALWAFVQSDSRNADLVERVGPLDLLLIDTEHVYEIAQAELALWGNHVAPGGVILMHDPETFPGVRRAATEFAAARGWSITFVLPNNGMAVIERPKV
jgi:predicted O-methyltransferase YrrM